MFNDSGEKELYIFNPDGSLDVSFGGRVTEGKWRYVSANKSIIVTANSESFMLDPEFIDNAIFALKLNGTNQYVFMIDENNTILFAPKTYKELMGYFEDKFNAAFALEEARIKAEAKRTSEENERVEKEKLTLYYQQKWIREKLPRDLYIKYKKRSYLFWGLSILGVIFGVCLMTLASVFFVLFVLFFFLVGIILGISYNYYDVCYFYLIKHKDDSFDSEWKNSWGKNWEKNFELYEKNVDLEEIKQMCLKTK